MTDRLLTFEINKKNESIEVHINQEGAKKLISYLEPLVDATGAAHFHLKTPSWAGSELSEERQKDTNELINHVEICFWPEQPQ